MQYVVVGMFRNYGAAEAAVRDLEFAGIVGEQVEVISDVDHDWRTANIPGEPSTEHHQHEVVADSGEQPNYIGAQEYYANHVRQGGAVVIVRTSAEPSANRAAAILHQHGAHSPGQKEGPTVHRVDQRAAF